MGSWRIVVNAARSAGSGTEREGTFLSCSIFDGGGRTVAQFVRFAGRGEDQAGIVRAAARVEVSYVLPLENAAAIDRAKITFAPSRRIPWLLVATLAIASACAVGCLLALAPADIANTEARPPSVWTDAEVAAWMLSSRVADEDGAAWMFQRASEIRMTEAIPKAVRFAGRSRIDDSQRSGASLGSGRDSRRLASSGIIGNLFSVTSGPGPGRSSSPNSR